MPNILGFRFTFRVNFSVRHLCSHRFYGQIKEKQIAILATWIHLTQLDKITISIKLKTLTFQRTFSQLVRYKSLRSW